MGAAVIRYRTTVDQADQNQRLIEKVFADLAATQPGNLRYQCIRLDDGITFIHVVDADNTDPLPAIDSFQEFRRLLGDRLASDVERTTGRLVGSYTG